MYHRATQEMPSTKNTSATGRVQSSQWNSPSIQMPLAQIQNTTARLCSSSDKSPRLRHAIQAAMTTVGPRMMLPSSRQSCTQQMSLKSQSTMWMFSDRRRLLKVGMIVEDVVAKGGNSPNFAASSIRMTIRQLLALAALFIGALGFGQGQSVLPYVMTVQGVVSGELSGEPLKGVKVRVLRDGELSNLIVTKGNGRFELELERNYAYRVEFTRDDLVDKHVLIDTHGAPPLLDVPSLTLIIDITLFTPVPSLDDSVFKEPLGKAHYKHSSRNIVWDEEYEQEISLPVRKFMAEYFREVERIGAAGKPQRPADWPPQ